MTTTEESSLDAVVELIKAVPRSEVDNKAPIIDDHYDVVNIALVLQARYNLVPKEDVLDPALQVVTLENLNARLHTYFSEFTDGNKNELTEAEINNWIADFYGEGEWL